MQRNSDTQLCPRCRSYAYSVHGSHSSCANCGYHTDEGDAHAWDQSPLYQEIIKQVDEDIRRFERLL